MTQKERNQKNQDKILASNKKNDDKWKEVRKEAVKKWHAANKDRAKDTVKKWHATNKDKVNKWHRDRKKIDEVYKLGCNIRCLLSNAFKIKKHKKTSKTSIILGCTFDEFKLYIESQFESWMTWDNYGCKVPSGPNMTWDLDHIIPISSAITTEDIVRLNHYTNFQPLCSFQNRFIKRDNVM